MAVKNGYDKIGSKLDAIKATKQTQLGEAKINKQSLGSNFENTKSGALKQLNAMGDIKQRGQQQVETTFDELTKLFKKSAPPKLGSLKTGSSTGDFLIKQLLLAAESTKSRLNEIVIDEVLNVAGCSEEQEFNIQNSTPNNSSKMYINVEDVDIRELLKNDPDSIPWKLRYEKNPIAIGAQPFSMDRELYNRLQNEGQSFSDEYGSSYKGSSGAGLFDLKYVTSYTEGGTTYHGNFYEVTLENRMTGNRIGDFLRDYYGSIELINFQGISTELMNQLTNIIDISGGISVDQKTEQSKFELIIQRILGLCFDNTKEIDVQGTAKLGQLDNIDDSFFEMSPTDLKNIEIEVNNMVLGVTEFTDCNNLKLPVNTEALLSSMTRLMENSSDNPEKNVDGLISLVDDMSKDENWKLQIPSGVNLNLNVAVNADFLKIIPKAVMFSVLTPKMLLGLRIVLKSINPNFQTSLGNGSLDSFIKTFGKFMVSMMSKMAAVFIEELFKLLKKNLRLLVESLLIEIVKEAKDKRVKIISAIIFILIQLISGFIDYRECKSLVDEILKLLNLGSAALGTSIPTFALAASSILGGFSPTRAMTEVTEGLNSLGIPTGDLPSGAPNMALPAISKQIKGTYDEQLANGKVEVFIPPLQVPPLVGGSTAPAKASGKAF